MAGSSNQRIGGSRAIRCGWYTLVAHMASRREMRGEGEELGFCNKTDEGRYFCFPLSRL